MNKDIPLVALCGIVSFFINAYLITGSFSGYHKNNIQAATNDQKNLKWYGLLFLTTAVLFVYSYFLYRLDWNFISFVLILSFLVSITPEDVKNHTVSNASLIVYAIFFAIVKICSWDGIEWLDDFLGLGAGTATLGIPYLIKRSNVGLGDIKVIGMLGFMLGLAGVVHLMLKAFLILLTVTLVLLARKSYDAIRGSFCPFFIDCCDNIETFFGG